MMTCHSVCKGSRSPGRSLPGQRSSSCEPLPHCRAGMGQHSGWAYPVAWHHPGRGQCSSLFSASQCWRTAWAGGGKGQRVLSTHWHPQNTAVRLPRLTLVSSATPSLSLGQLSSSTRSRAGGCAGNAALCKSKEPAATPGGGPNPEHSTPSTTHPGPWRCTHPRSPSPWRPGGAASAAWPRCSRAAAGCQDWRRRARGVRC